MSRRARGHGTAGEVTGAVLLLPVVVTMVFLVIHAALVYHARSVVAAAAEDGTESRRPKAARPRVDEPWPTRCCAAPTVSFRRRPCTSSAARRRDRHGVGSGARSHPVAPPDGRPAPGSGRTLRPRENDERASAVWVEGSAGVSVVLLTPVVLALLAFAVLAGQVGTAHQDVVSAAQAAATPASVRARRDGRRRPGGGG